MNEKKKSKRWERTNTANLWKLASTGGYYARVKVNGKEKWRSLKTKLSSVAKLRLAVFERETRIKGQRSLEAAAKTTDTTCGSLLDHVLADLRLDTGLKQSSKTRSETSAKAIVKTWPEFRALDVRNLTPSMCKQWAARAQREGTGFVAPGAVSRPQPMSASAFNKTLDFLRSVMRLAIKLGLIYADPTEDIKKMSQPKNQLALPSVKQFREIVEEVSTAGARQSKDCADMVRLLAYTGARLEEARSLTWECVLPDKKLFRVKGTKSETSDRYIPLFPPLRELMDEIRTRRGKEKKNVPILRVKECKEALGNACERVGVKPMTHHGLRHLFATRCIESGVDIPTVSRWLGHADGGALAMRTYGHLRQDHSLAQAAKVTW